MTGIEIRWAGTGMSFSEGTTVEARPRNLHHAGGAPGGAPAYSSGYAAARDAAAAAAGMDGFSAAPPLPPIAGIPDGGLLPLPGLSHDGRGEARPAAGAGLSAAEQLRQQQQQQQQQYYDSLQDQLDGRKPSKSAREGGGEDQRVSSTLFHELGRSLPPHMKTGAAMAVDWDQYVGLRKKHAPALAWSEEEEVSQGGRVRSPPRAAGQSSMFPALVPPLVPRPPPSQEASVGGRSFVEHHREVIDELRANSGQGMSSMMRALREAAAAHARNAEMAHAHAIVNPKLARRDIEKLLRDHEPHVSRAERAARKLRGDLVDAGGGGGGGNKRNRRLRVASTDMGDVNLMMKPRPPKGRKKGGRRGGGGSEAHEVDAPALQPMPRFAGAGPVANGALLRPTSHVGGMGSAGFAGVSTF